MNTVICPKCRTTHELTKDLSNEESLTCIACGTIFKNPLYDNSSDTALLTKKQKRRIIILVVIIILYLIGKNDNASSSRYVITKDTYATTDKQAWDDLGKYSLSGNKNGVYELIFQDKIVLLTKGTEVDLVESKFSYCIVRKVNTTRKLWIPIENIEQ